MLLRVGTIELRSRSMKIVFLDIDGVLNSQAYDRVRGLYDGVIDESRLPLLKRILQESDAKVVLTSSWRRHFDPEGIETDYTGRLLEEQFYKFDIELYDKTPDFGGRAEEIGAWVEDAEEEIESFVILDDLFFGWGDLASRLVRTDARIGRGLEEHHVNEALEILATPL